jgi:hypothetical protein
VKTPFSRRMRSTCCVTWAARRQVRLLWDLDAGGGAHRQLGVALRSAPLDAATSPATAVSHATNQVVRDRNASNSLSDKSKPNDGSPSSLSTHRDRVAEVDHFDLDATSDTRRSCLKVGGAAPPVSEDAARRAQV